MIRKIFNNLFRYEAKARRKIKWLLAHQDGKERIVTFFMRQKIAKEYKIIIGKKAKIGENLYLPHPQNIMLGSEVVIGNNVTIYHDVTLGQNRGKFPVIGNNVIIYAGSKVVGGITVGNNVVIGANCVVTKDIPDNAVVAGNPARLISYRGEEDGFY